MAPNINALSRPIDEFLYESEEEVSTFEVKNADPRLVGRRLWKALLHQTTAKADEGIESGVIGAALSCIRILDCQDRNRQWLMQFDATLHETPLDMVGALKERAPVNFAARVADFNDNLFYEMQPEKGLGHLGMSSDSLDEVLGSGEYLGSFLTTETSMPQPPHVDYTWEILDQYSPNELKVGFFPLTTEGMFLQVWPRRDMADQVTGEIIFVPYGKLLILPAHTIHGGGYRTTPLDAGTNGNLRFHLYVARNQASLPEHQTNKYTEPSDKSKELLWRYVDSPMMKKLLEYLFV